ncbi:MAG: group II intron reverse transcriptase/maturase, partial [Sweet potato little leaf phytoplasma]|nr:group II intron reverse transcriptase/maturase [Sweet potato little leaf phytoplasma]
GKPIRKSNPEYWKAWKTRQHHKLEIDRHINLNPKPRVEYIRYADDFIIGIKSEYNQAERIKDQVTQWLKQYLN